MNYKINELAKLAAISVRTLQYYDKIGLLSPSKRASNNYRVYHDEDINTLQQILFFKEMGFKLQQIKLLVKDMRTEKRLAMLDKHLESLHKEIYRKQQLIENVTKTIQSLKGDIHMKHHEKFEGLKKEILENNERNFKDEVVKNWGEWQYKTSKEAFKSMSEETYNQFKHIEAEIILTLKQLKHTHDVLLEKKVYELHTKWIHMAWGNNYSKEAHLGIVDMYLDDSRFKHYYDQHEEGLAELLKDAICAHI